MRTLAKTTLAIFLVISLGGCDAVLQGPSPSTSVSQEVALSDANAIRGVRASMYDRFHSQALSTDWQLGPSSLADNTAWRSGEARHQGLNQFNRSAGLGTGAYNNLYNMINDANLLINGIEEGALEQGVRQKFKAEALFIRALALHHAVRIFGYDPAGPNPDDGLVTPETGPGQGFNLGVVVRTKPTLTPEDASDKARSTVHEVYNQIESDLKTAKELFSNLPSDVKEKDFHYPSQAAVEAIRARVNLYQRDWDAANTAAENAINLAGSLFDSRLAEPSELKDIFDETTGDNPEAIFQIRTVAQNSTGVNNSLHTYTAGFFIAQLPIQDLLDLYESDDARREPWYGPCIISVRGTDPGGCTARNDKGLELEKYESERGASLYADDYMITRIAEMVLIQAEARLHTQNVDAAISRLNDLRAKRGASMLDPANFDQGAAMNEILDERRRELVAEGHRFFDLKRLGRDIPKDHLPQVSDVPFSSIKILDDLPTSQVEVNKPLKQNPGYK